MREPQETHMSSHLDEIVAAVSLTPGKTIPNKPPQTALFQPPREKLHLCEEKAKSCSSRREYKQAIQELVRCVALTRICYGDCHWKLAEAYVNLAQGYLQLEGLSLQAKQHAEKAREVLASAIAPPCDNSTDVFRCSVELFHTMGRAFLSLQKFKEAAKNLTKAERLSQELLQCGRVAKEEWLEVQAQIKLSFAQMYQAQKKSKEALPHYQEALEYTEISKGEKSLECAPVLRELAGAEQALKCHDAAINHFLQAHLIVLGGEPSEEEAAASSHCVARAAVASGRPEHHDVAEQYFQESLASLHHAEGTGKAKLLSIQDEYCHFLQVTGQEERATSILRESLKAKVGVFGDLSPEVAETYRLLSGADLAQGNHSGAHKKLNKRPLPAAKSGEHHGHQTEISTEKAHMLLLHRDPAWFRDGVIADIFTQVEGCKKELVKAVSLCLQIQTLLYGPQDRRTLATQQSMDVLSKAPEMAGKLRQAPKAKPASCLGVAQHTAPGKARPHTVN